MATWKRRFEELFAEIEGEESPSLIRKRELKSLIIRQLNEGLAQGELKSEDIEKVLNFINEINFYEDI